MLEAFCTFRKCSRTYHKRRVNHLYCSKECRDLAKMDRLPTMVKRVPKIIECPNCRYNIDIKKIKNQR